jgi:hypothetical protein
LIKREKKLFRFGVKFKVLNMHISFNIPKIAFIIIIMGFLFSCNNQKLVDHQPIVEVRYHERKAQLYRHGEPYFIKGAAGPQYLDKVAAYGANSIRTWDLNNADSLLDLAHELGLTVTLGLEIGRPSWGQSFNYWKFWEVSKKIEELKPIIEKYKDHPALLMWGVGNELEQFGGGKRFLLYYTINRVGKMIKEIDPNHPTMAAFTSYTEKSRTVSMPYIDVIGYNSFDAINLMHDIIYGEKGFDQAYIFSEWGPSGHWETPNTEWGAPKELKNSAKRELMEKHWEIIHSDNEFLLGSYAFYWGNKMEVTPTWFSLFGEDGSETESVHFLKSAWTGQKTDNLAPQVHDLFIETNNGVLNDNVYLENNVEYAVIAQVTDPENDTITYKWEIRPEESYFFKNKTINYDMDHLILNEEDNKITFVSPIDEGPYRVFVFAFDGKGNVASYNIPFYVLMK